MDIEWTQVIVAFILGVIFSAAVKSAASSLKSKVQGA